MKPVIQAIVGTTGTAGAAVFVGLAVNLLLGRPAHTHERLAANSPLQRQHGGVGADHCVSPAQVLNLTSWKLTVPMTNPRKPTGDAQQIAQPALASFERDPWFVVQPGCHGVRFRAPVNGVTTKGSKYPRSELREMRADGRSPASWSSSTGTHTMTIREAITHVPVQKPDVVAGQIHDASSDLSVFRLEGRKLYVTDGNNSHYKLVTSDYVLGTVFEARYVVSDGTINAYYNGALQASIHKPFAGAYFKAGVYTQANCTNASPCSDANYGEVVIYQLTTSHT